MRKTMKPFSVLLLYPDYIAETFGQETYYGHVLARTRRSAVKKAREECATSNEFDRDFDLSDLHCLLLLSGHHTGLLE